MVKFALTGAHGTGKTTLASALVRRVRNRWRVEVTPEVPRLIIEDVGDRSFFRRGHNTFERQCLIIARQLEIEHERENPAVDLLICDRTVLDHWGYATCLFPGEVVRTEARLWAALVARWAKTYDCVVHVPIEAPLADDGVREGEAEFQRAIDAAIVRLYGEQGIVISAVRGTIDERVTECERVIAELMATKG